MAAAAAFLVLAPEAFAGTATTLGGSDGTTTTFTAGAGEANTLTVTFDSGANDVVFDDGSRTVDSDALVATCQVSGTNDRACDQGASTGLRIVLGDSVDSVTFVGFGAYTLPVTVDGGAGNDTLNGAQVATTFLSAAPDGDDVITGNAAAGDTLDFTGRTTALAVDLANTAKQTITGSEADTLAGLENATGGTGNDTLLGSEAANVLEGGAGADIIAGLGGADTLTGLAGNDVIAGGAGNDVAVDGGADNDILQGGLGNDAVTGGAGTDTVSYGDSERTAGVTVAVNDAAAAAQTIAAGETETLATVENVVGSPQADTITDIAGVNVLDGRAGNDTIVAEPGTTGGLPPAPNNQGDTYRGGDGTDTVTYDSAANRRTTDLTLSLDATANDGATGENDQIADDVENVNGGSGNDTITGSTAANALSGGAGNDTINARENVKDTIACGAGTDKATVDPLDEVADCETVDRNAVPVVSATDVAVPEGAAGTSSIATVKVSLGAALPYAATVKYATTDGNAKAGSDYEATSGTLTFAPGETEKSVGVTIKGDNDVEPNEVLGFVLSSPTAAALKGNGTTLIGIIADDAAPSANPPVAPATKVRGLLTGKGTPVRDRKAPYAFVLTGKLTLPAGTKATCAGEKLTVATKLGDKTTKRTVSLATNCTYKLTLKVGKPKNKLPTTGRRVVVSLSTAGTATLLKAATKKVSLRIG